MSAFAVDQGHMSNCKQTSLILLLLPGLTITNRMPAELLIKNSLMAESRLKKT
jgi:hypothetical protein